MENSRPTRRPRRMREPRHLGMPLLGSPPLRNHLKPIEILSQDQLMAIHEASLRLLEETGIEFMGAAARSRFREAGAQVDEASGHILGASIFGHAAEELIHVFALAIRYGITADQLKDTIFAFPTFSADIKFLA